MYWPTLTIAHSAFQLVVLPPSLEVKLGQQVITVSAEMLSAILLPEITKPAASTGLAKLPVPTLKAKLSNSLLSSPPTTRAV
jgi:hypothetical protein